MKIVLDSKDLTEGLEDYSQELLVNSKDQNELRERLTGLEGAASFVRWILANYCSTLTNLADCEIEETLTQYKKCIRDPEVI